MRVANPMDIFVFRGSDCGSFLVSLVLCWQISHLMPDEMAFLCTFLCTPLCPLQDSR